jgi:tRNA A-37 threonylcarbamoyl transferase component Bud32
MGLEGGPYLGAEAPGRRAGSRGGKIEFVGGRAYVAAVLLNETFAFAGDVPPQERSHLRGCIREALGADREIQKGHHSAKKFYLLESIGRKVFIKTRRFGSFFRRLERTIRGTKEETEFRNFLRIKEKGIPCPEPIASARLRSGPVVHTSLLLVEYLPRAATLREFLTREIVPREEVLEGLFAFLRLLRDKGFIHEDLQWNNILVDRGGNGLRFLVIDALHTRFPEKMEDDDFAKTLLWFSAFLSKENAPPELRDRFLERACVLHPGLDRHPRAVEAIGR